MQDAFFFAPIIPGEELDARCFFWLQRNLELGYQILFFFSYTACAPRERVKKSHSRIPFRPDNSWGRIGCKMVFFSLRNNKSRVRIPFGPTTPPAPTIGKRWREKKIFFSPVIPGGKLDARCFFFAPIIPGEELDARCFFLPLKESRSRILFSSSLLYRGSDLRPRTRDW